MEETFTEIYEKNLWGNNNNNNYSGSSGHGSSIEYNTEYIKILRKIIKDYSISSVVDLGCGDFMFGKLIYDDLDIVYTGYDAYKKVCDYNSSQFSPDRYSFNHLDFFKEREFIIGADICILKDVIQHWTLNDINIFLNYLTNSKKFKYILIVNCGNQMRDNTECKTGHFRPLSCFFDPLKKYNAQIVANYNTKEISIIKL